MKEKETIRSQLTPLLDLYAPFFAEHGVACSISFNNATAVTPRANRYGLLARLLDRLYQKFSITSLYDGGGPRKQKQFYLILQFHPLNPTKSKQAYREYSFIIRTADYHRTNTRKTEKVIRSVEKLLSKKQTLLLKQDPEALCSNTPWDVLRYTFGNYWYKKSAMGIDLGFLRFTLFVALLVIFGLIELFIHL